MFHPLTCSPVASRMCRSEPRAWCSLRIAAQARDCGGVWCLSNRASWGYLTVPTPRSRTAAVCLGETWTWREFGSLKGSIPAQWGELHTFLFLPGMSFHGAPVDKLPWLPVCGVNVTINPWTSTRLRVSEQELPWCRWQWPQPQTAKSCGPVMACERGTGTLRDKQSTWAHWRCPSPCGTPS